MQARTPGRRTARTYFLAAVAGLAVFNVARGLGAFGSWADVVLVAVALSLVVFAVRAGFTRSDLGLAAEDAAAGLRWGALALLVTTVVLIAAAAIPATRKFLEDDRADVSGTGLVLEILVPILVLTVIPEELTFRSTLFAAGRAAWSERVALLATSVLFGLWHISATLGTADSNDRFDDAADTGGGTFGLVAGSVALTFVAGLVFGWLRLRSRSVVAPMLAHLATNAIALTVAWVVVR